MNALANQKKKKIGCKLSQLKLKKKRNILCSDCSVLHHICKESKTNSEKKKTKIIIIPIYQYSFKFKFCL